MPAIALILSTLALWTIYWFVRMGGIDHIREAHAEAVDVLARRVGLAPAN
jgi:hypothetical protein